MQYERILLDFETQRDYFDPSGKCFQKGADRVLTNVRRLFKWVRAEHVPVISTMLWTPQSRDVIPVDDDDPVCVVGTPGSKKVGGTVLPKHITFDYRNTTDLPWALFDSYQQVVFESRFTDIFVHPRIDRLITQLGKSTYIICGATLDGSVMQAVLGLRARGAGVIVVCDAVLSPAGSDTDMEYRRLDAKGAVICTASQVIAHGTKSRRRRPKVIDSFRTGS